MSSEALRAPLVHASLAVATSALGYISVAWLPPVCLTLANMLFGYLRYPPSEPECYWWAVITGRSPPPPNDRRSRSSARSRDLTDRNPAGGTMELVMWIVAAFILVSLAGFILSQGFVAFKRNRARRNG